MVELFMQKPDFKEETKENADQGDSVLLAVDKLILAITNKNDKTKELTK